jgi:hypothetical protein
MRRRENRLRLQRMLYDELDFSFGGHDVVLVAPVQRARPHRDAAWPGPVTRLDRLIPNHPARIYLEKRNFDPDELAENYSVSYCAFAEAWCGRAGNRLIIPCFHEGKLVGWQARALYDPVPKGVPRYYTMPHFKAGSWLYNGDRARAYPYVVITEGPTKVWRFGPQAVALFGKNAGHEQCRLLSAWPRAVILLDPAEENRAIWLARRLASLGTHCVRVQLAGGLDPGDCERAALRDAVFTAALAQGLDLEGEDNDHGRQAAALPGTGQSRLPAGRTRLRQAGGGPR